ncbi:MAG: hypothetical protein SGJ00_13475 [bacterium]|nr:hypothetical protein [bacterium]
MKNLPNKLTPIIAIAILILFSLYACEKSKKENNQKDQQNSTLIGAAYTGSDTIVRFTEDSVGIGYIHNGLFYLNNLDTSNYLYTENNVNYTMSHFRLEESHGIYDLVMFGTGTNGEHILLGFSCFIDVPNYVNPNSPIGGTIKNSCTGVCCSSCSFTRNSVGSIDGCACGRSGTGCGENVSPHCDHSMSEGFTKDSYEDYIRNYSEYPPYDTY